MGPLSVGIVTSTVGRAGGGIFPIVLAHARELALQGHNVVVHGLNDDPENRDRSAWGELSLNLHPAGSFGYAPNLFQGLLKAEHDIIHQHGLWMYPSIAVSRWRARTGKPTVVSTQGMVEPWALANSKLKKRIAWRLFEGKNLEKMSLIHCSRGEVAGIRAANLRNAIAAIPNGVDIPESNRFTTRPHFLGEDNRKNLLFLGRLHPKKGLSETFQAFAKFKASQPPAASSWRLLVAGWDDGGHMPQYRKLVADLGLEDDIAFLGAVYGSEKQAILANADAFVLASYSEGFPMAVLEALSYSLPVFMTPECNIPEALTSDAAIEISHDPNSIADAFVTHLNRPDLRNVGERGLQFVRSRFSWQSIVGDLATSYYWALGSVDRPPFIVTD